MSFSMGKNELEFYKKLVIMFMKSVNAYASGKGSHPLIHSAGPEFATADFLHPLLLIESGGSFQM